MLLSVSLPGDDASQAEYFDMGMRIRGLAQGPDGAIWALEGGSRGGNGRLFRLTPNP